MTFRLLPNSCMQRAIIPRITSVGAMHIIPRRHMKHIGAFTPPCPFTGWAAVGAARAVAIVGMLKCCTLAAPVGRRTMIRRTTQVAHRDRPAADRLQCTSPPTTRWKRTHTSQATTWNISTTCTCSPRRFTRPSGHLQPRCAKAARILRYLEACAMQSWTVMAVVVGAVVAEATTATSIRQTTTLVRPTQTLVMRLTRFGTRTQTILTSCLGEVDDMCMQPTAERAPHRRR